MLQVIKITAVLHHLNSISLTILLILLFMSILTWYLIIIKTLQLGFIYWQARKISNLFWNNSSLAPLMIHLSQTQLHDPFTQLTLQALNAAIYYEKRLAKNLTTLCNQNEFLSRQLRRAMTEETARLESGLSILATISSTAPFMGLLGTVLGIYDALMAISVKGTASLETVAAPVGEALIMTAGGLAVAIPAVLGYNALIRGQKAFLNKLNSFAHDLQTCLNTGARIDMKNIAYIKQHLQLHQAEAARFDSL
jgi:biopolymer transport protein ExbB